MPSVRRIVRRIAEVLPMLLLGAGCVGPTSGVLSVAENRIVYQPSQTLDLARVPDDLQYEDAWIDTHDGVTLHGWYCPVDNPRALVLFAHGNAGNIADRAELIRTWTKQLRVSMLAFDYRGYGQSTGKASESGFAIDVRAARRWLAERENVDEQQIVLYGRSLGGAVMVELAAADGARGMILESTFTSLRDLVEWKLPLPGVSDRLTNEYATVDRLPSFSGPLLIAHGKNDMVVPIAHGRQLFDAAKHPKQFVPIPDAKHNWRPPYDYLLTVSRFIDRLP